MYTYKGEKEHVDKERDRMRKVMHREKEREMYNREKETSGKEGCGRLGQR